MSNMARPPKRGVFILECRDQKDPGSEGRFLAHMFRLMAVPHQHIDVQTKEQFMAMLSRSPYELIHIATHGSVAKGPKGERFVGLWFPDGTVDVAALQNLKGVLRDHSVIITACLSGQREFAKALITKGYCKYVVAPTGSPKFHNSIFFSHILYHQYFILRRSLSEILKRYDSKYKNPHQFAAIPLSRYGLHFVRD